MTPEQLAETLIHGAEPDRIASAQTLASMGAAAAPAAVALVRGCGDAAVAEWCVGALEELGQPPSDLIPDLTSFVESSHSDTAYWAATLLGRCGADASSAASVLANAATSNAELVVRERAVWALGKIGPSASDALPLLEKLAASEEARLARLAGQAIESIGGG